jgi:hypothetical protein
MYPSTTPALSCRRESIQAVQDLARQLRFEAEAVESVRERLRGAQGVSWDSPAGRNFRSYLAERAATVAATAAYLREVAFALDAYSAALATGEGEGIRG